MKITVISHEDCNRRTIGEYNGECFATKLAALKFLDTKFLFHWTEDTVGFYQYPNYIKLLEREIHE
jgi:hypothetical protein